MKVVINGKEYTELPKGALSAESITILFPAGGGHAVLEPVEPELKHGDFGFSNHNWIKIGNHVYWINGSEKTDYSDKAFTLSRKGNIADLLDQCGKDGKIIALTEDEVACALGSIAFCMSCEKEDDSMYDKIVEKLKGQTNGR